MAVARKGDLTLPSTPVDPEPELEKKGVTVVKDPDPEWERRADLASALRPPNGSQATANLKVEC